MIKKKKLSDCEIYCISYTEIHEIHEADGPRDEETETETTKKFT